MAYFKQADSSLHLGAPASVFKKARMLRRSMTLQEIKVWDFVKSLRIQGIHIRRQHPIGFYVADFYCHSHRLVIEIDGPNHNAMRIMEFDQEKESFYRANGIEVIRFTNEEVNCSFESVEQRIKDKIGLS